MRSMRRSSDAVVADHQRAAAPALQQVRHRGAPVGVEVVGRLVHHDEVGLGDQEGRQRRAGRLAAAQGRGGAIQRGSPPAPSRPGAASMRCGNVQSAASRSPRPALAGFEPRQPRQRLGDAQEVGRACAPGGGLQLLAQRRDAAGNRHGARGRREPRRGSGGAARSCRRRCGRRGRSARARRRGVRFSKRTRPSGLVWVTPSRVMRGMIAPGVADERSGEAVRLRIHGGESLL